MNNPVKQHEIPKDQRSALRRVGSWRKFHKKVRKSSRVMLGELRTYKNAILVAGCQRSGTTMVTRIIANSADCRGLSLTRDDELDAALALCGEIDLPSSTRYCFQTTYLNERYPEYKMMGPENRLIWVLRNPRSVVSSMVYNWKRFALNELYNGCGASDPQNTVRSEHSGVFGMSAIAKAFLSYSAKTSQIHSIREIVNRENILVVDYDSLVVRPQEHLPRIFSFIGEPYKDEYAGQIHADSLSKARQVPLSCHPKLAEQAEAVYRNCLSLVPDVIE